MERISIGVDRPVCFLHIPKTGGTSLSGAIGELFPPDRVFSDAGNISVDYLRGLGDRLCGRGFITGHPGTGVVNYLDGKADVITLFRRPEEQAVSQYLHVRADPDNQFHAAANSLSISQYMRRHPYQIAFQAISMGLAIAEGEAYNFENIQNDITKILDAMDSMAFVGVIDRAEDCAILLSHLMNNEGSIKLRALNASSVRGISSSQKSALLEEYKSLRYDPELAYLFAIEDLIYAKANAILSKTLGRYGEVLDIDRARAAFGRTAAPRFFSPAGRLEQGQYVCPLAGADGNLIHGPYERLQPGGYEVEFQFTIQGAAPDDRGMLKLEVVANTRRYLATRTLAGAKPLPDRRRTLAFRCGDAGDVLEFRIRGSGYGAGELMFDGVTVRPASRGWRR